MTSLIMAIGLGSEKSEPTEPPFRNPSDVKMFAGYGAEKSDLERGYLEPEIDESPKYDKANYVDKWTLPRVPDEDSNEGEDLRSDVEFRMKDRRTKGLFMRPRIPTER